MVALYDHDVPVVQPAMPRADASFGEATISSTDDRPLRSIREVGQRVQADLEELRDLTFPRD